MVTKPLNPQVLDLAPGDIPVAPPPFTAPSARSAPPPEGRTGPALKISFQLVGPPAATVRLDVWRVTVLGRADPMSAFRPDIDYAPYGAVRYGVSRRHALLRPHNGRLDIVDQNSTNGTWVNGQRLMPGQGFPLGNGDTVELGALRMTFNIDDTPARDVAAHPEQPAKPRMKGFRFRFLGKRR